MSRIGKTPVAIPSGVTVEVKDGSLAVTGPKGTLTFPLFTEVSVKIEDGVVQVNQTGSGSAKRAGAFHGLVRAHLANMVVGVTEGFRKELEIIGTGWNAKPQGSGVELQVGFCHPVQCDPPEGVTVSAPTNTELLVEGIDKQKVGQFAANIRMVRPPEPYKGKGIRYKGEYVRRKAGKTLA